MKPTTVIVALIAALVLLPASHLHDEAHRYDVVVAGAGSGGSQETEGSAEIVGYLADHKTGRVWVLTGFVQKPTVVLSCSQLSAKFRDTARGCETDTAPQKQP